MSALHPAIRDLLDARAADVAQDIDNTVDRLRVIRSELATVEVTLERLRVEERAISDARELLTRIAPQDQEAET